MEAFTTNINHVPPGLLPAGKMLFTPAEVAKFCGRSVSWAYQAIRDGSIVSRRVGKRRMVPRGVLETWQFTPEEPYQPEPLDATSIALIKQILRDRIDQAGRVGFTKAEASRMLGKSEEAIESLARKNILQAEDRDGELVIYLAQLTPGETADLLATSEGNTVT